MTFQDHFSGHAADYARFRPRYPAELFTQLAAWCSEHRQAWDCGTGSGQAATALAEHFEQVRATDASPQQLGNAVLHRRVAYHVADEGNSGLADQSTDFVSAAQALHWFHADKFFTEARRVLRPKGVIAVWCYHLLRLGEPLDAVLNKFYSHTVGPHWPPERALVEQGYRSIAFPFEELPPPVCEMEQELSLDGLLNYLGTWSATKRFQQAKGFSPLPMLEKELRPLWGDRHQLRRVCWPLHIRVGRNRT